MVEEYRTSDGETGIRLDLDENVRSIAASASGINTQAVENGRKLDKMLEKMGYAQTLSFLNLIVLVVIAVLIAVHWVLVFT